MPTVTSTLKDFLDRKVEEYNQPSFIAADPVCIPHRFSRMQDIEIAGFFAAIFAWGNRTTIIQKAGELMDLMDGAPFDFCKNHQPQDLKRMLHFRHRTFQTTDLLYVIEFLRYHYSLHASLEHAFARWMDPSDTGMEKALNGFHRHFFSLPDAPPRTRKHIAMPARGSTCKRLNMYLRWMVRADDRGVDFGIWKQIRPAQLICPVDLHVARVAARFGLITRKQVDWQTAVELTENLRAYDPADPVKYDFALFGLGVAERF